MCDVLAILNSSTDLECLIIQAMNLFLQNLKI